MSTWITRLDAAGKGPRVAVKDLVDVEGVPTTAGSRAVERNAKPAERDAACLKGFRAAGARLMGKTNLHELAVLPLGINPWFGTPVNPLDAAQLDELREAIVTLTDLRELLADSERLTRAALLREALER